MRRQLLRGHILSSGLSQPRSYFVGRDSHTTYTRGGDEVDVVWDGAPRPIFSVRLAILLVTGGCSRAVVPAPAPDPSRFESEIRAFEAADRVNPPAPGGTVLVGSSSIKNWTDVAADFPDLPVINRGFGGSTLADVVYYAGRVVLPYRPRLIVLYAGDNDLAEGRTPGQIVADYHAFLGRVRSALPGIRVAYVSIKPSPSRRALINKARDTNARIRSVVARDSLQTYVDIFTPMLNSAGDPRPELFLGDSLHMNRKGYDLWRGRLAPVVAADPGGH